DDHRMAADAAVAASRAAVGSRDVGRALGAAREAIDRARAAGGRSLAARAAYAAAFAHLAVGDLDAVEREAGECLRAAHAGRDPLHAIRARLLIAEAARRRGRRSAVAGLLTRLDKVAAASLPPIVR